MSDDRIALLEKIIYIQSCVLEGHSIKAMIRKESRYFREESGAQVIAVCVENEEHIDIELVLEEKKKFLTLIRKHRLTPKRMDLKKFIELCHEHFARSQEYIKIESLHDIFRGTLSKKSSAAFEKEMDFDHALLFPLRNSASKKIGFVLYFFSTETPVEVRKMVQLTEVFETLIRPFYDRKRRVLHTKCVQVDEKMQRLTEKEKQITQCVLAGKPYKTISDELGISTNTIKTHMRNIFSKYGVNSKIELHNKLMGTF